MKRPNLVSSSFLTIALCILIALPSEAANPEVKIATGPMFSGRGNVHPNVLLSLSVEFPTVGVAYRGDNGTYNRNAEYIGYFNPARCYVYNGGNRNLSSTGYFRIHKSADPATRECGGDSFSGNFMNWATASAIDMLRYALTGGDRVVDSPTQTVLQRAVLRDSDKNNFYAHGTYFPRRKVVATVNTSAPNQVTPFNTSTLYVVSCRNRILFSDTSSGLNGNKDADSKMASSYCASTYDGTGVPPADAVDKKLGDYLARVEVCDAKEGAERIDLCQKYANGYKPVGVLQRKSERVRVAAMSYLLDDSEKRYGGVLRVPMKYLGAKKTDAPDFLAGANDRPEWNPDTGVFYSNPENPSDRNSTVAHSGVINYLNKFGDNGVYKTFDPVSELYYEAIRYLQGRSPTPEALEGVTEAMKDRFPAIDKWVDPVVASCQQNHILSIADVNTHWDRYVPGNDRSTYGAGTDAFDKARAADSAVAAKTPALDVKAWAKRVGDMELDAGGAYTNPAKNAAMTDLHNKDTGAGGHGTYYMAGLAYWANTNDIRVDKPTRVKTIAIDVDEGGNGLVDGNTRTIKPRDSQLYLAAKYGGFEDRNNDGNPFITFASDGKTIVKGSNVEWANGNGVPSNYFLASQPREMISSIRKIFDSIGAASGTISGVSVSTAKISSDGAFVYQPSFDSSRWSGKLQKLALKPAADGTIDVSKSALWDAGELLTGTGDMPANPLPGARNIFTASVGSGGSLSIIEFKWDKLTETQKALLDTSPVDKLADGRGEQRVNFLRGERSMETSQPNGIFRARDRVLGDILNSNVVYVAAPAMNVLGAGYQEFYKNYASRSRVVYVGANDGMLHAFSADDGRELFAYVPNAVIPRMNFLTQPEYEHHAYVDGTISVGDAWTGGQWKTVLVSGMGGGAQGVFALDVTNPGSFGKGSGAIFEFTDADDPDMGNLMTAPVIAKFRTSPVGSTAQYKYFAVVASGFNNYKPDGYRADGKPRFNTDASTALFLLSLDKPVSDKWQKGVNYYKFRVPSKDPSLQNGLSSPALVVGANGAVLYAYAGDLQGNLWRFEFTGAAPWSHALAGANPLFAAKDGNGKRQAISTQPKVVFAPGGGYVVLFGTGKFIEDADTASGSFSTQSFYGIYDAKKSNYTVNGRTELTPRDLEKSGDDAFKITGADISYGSGADEKKGWYFDFLDSSKTGERVVTNPLLSDGLLFFNSVIPGSDPCVAGGGRSYALNTLSGVPPNGASAGFLSLVGMLSSPVLLETGAEVSDRNATGKRVVKKRFSIVNFGTGGVKGTAASTQNGSGEVTVRAGRFSWREVLNWQELRNALKK